MRVAIYARFSSDLQRAASIEDQVRLCTVRADRESWQIVGTFTDAAISGATMLRPGYQALLAAMRAGEVDIVLAESLDRISRDLEHVAAFHKAAMFCRVRIVTLSEGEVSDLHVGLKGTMGQLYLKDLKAKTLRGQEGRIRQGRAIGGPPYGYRVVRRLGADGEPERGLREVDPDQARAVRRIYEAYVAGTSPLAIARALNRDGVPAPRGRTWYDLTLRGRPTRGDGILRNPLYTGRLQWNRSHTVVDPVSGTEVWRPKAGEDWVETAVPHLRIVPDELWQAAQDRLAAEAVPQPAVGHHPFWQRRRPQHLLTGKVVCGCCGTGFSVFGKDYLGCRTARNGGACRNTTRVRRAVLEDRVLQALGTQLMRSDLVASFCATFIEEWNRLAAEASAGAEARQRELHAIERKIANLVEAIADGLKAPGVQQKLEDLEARRQDVQAALDAGPPVAPPALHPNLAQVYADKVAALRHALAAEDGTEALEAARALIDTVVVSPPNDPSDPPGIELTGNLMAMLKAGGAALPPEDRTLASCLTTMLESSVQEDPRGRFPSPNLLLRPSKAHGLPLLGEQLRRPGPRQAQQRHELGIGERRTLGGALHFHDPARAGQHEIRVRIGLAVLGIVEVEHRRALPHPAGDGGDLVLQRVAGHDVHPPAMLEGEVQRDPGAGDGGAARSAIGGQHVAIDGDRHLAHRLHVRDGAERAADQALDLLGTAGLLAAGGLAVAPRVGGARQHAVFGGDPALPLAAQEGWHLALHAGGAQHLGHTHADQAGPLGVPGEAGLEADGAKGGGVAAGGAHGAGFPRKMVARLLQCRGRACTRGAAGAGAAAPPAYHMHHASGFRRSGR
jgi:DNA invertase Pin-like site-specific DNA recombinase